MNPCDHTCKFLSFLPLNHIYERSMNYHYQAKGISIYYAESMGTIQQNMQEIEADGFCAVPRVLEMVHDKLYAAGKDFRGVKKKIYDWAFSHGKRYDYTLLKKVSLFYQLVQWFLDKAVYSKWREKFGGKRLTVITGGSSIQPDMVRLFAAAGINIYEGYGLSETSPVIAVNDPAHHQVKIGTVGPVLEGVELMFDEDGEILTRGPHVMLGYYKDPEYTKQVIDENGYDLKPRLYGQVRLEGDVFMGLSSQGERVYWEGMLNLYFKQKPEVIAVCDGHLAMLKVDNKYYIPKLKDYFDHPLEKQHIFLGERFTVMENYLVMNGKNSKVYKIAGFGSDGVLLHTPRGHTPYRLLSPKGQFVKDYYGRPYGYTPDPYMLFPKIKPMK